MSDFPALPYPWQQGLWQNLVGLHEAGRLPHALMLAGPAGIGKTPLAQSLMQLVLCEAPISSLACGKCKSCGLNRAGTHPDFTALYPEESGKAIKVDAIREAAIKLTKTAQISEYKVVVLAPADAMNTNAANALLKTLEEPADKTLLILVTDSVNAVLPTIRSRCQIKSLAIPPVDDSLKWLSPLVVGAQYTAEDLLEAARGAPLTALALLTGDGLEVRAGWLSDLSRVSTGQADALSVASNWYNTDMIQLLNWFAAWLHDVACWKAGVDTPIIESLDSTFTKHLENISESLLHRYVEKLLHSKRLLLSGANPNKQLMAEEILLDWGVLLRARA